MPPGRTAPRPPHPAGPGSRPAPSSRPRVVDGELLTQAEVEHRIVDIADAMEDFVHDLEARSDAMADAEVAWQLARARTRLDARAKPGSGPGGRTTNDEADDIAMTQHPEQFTAAVVAEARYNAAVQALKARTAQLDGLRAVNANLRPLVT